jgi:hypothetical protein
LISLSALTDFLFSARPRALEAAFLAVFFFGDLFKRVGFPGFFLVVDFFFALALFDVCRLVFVFFLLEGMAAVYHQK